MTVSVLVVDDHEVVRVGLAALLQEEDELTVVGAVGTARDAVGESTRTRPDVIVMDVRLPDGSGIEACREILSRLPRTCVLMLTSYPDEEAVLASILAGASGYLLKDTGGSDLVSAVKRVASGASLLDPAVTGVVLARLRADSDMTAKGLDARDREILELIANGRTNSEIGEVLTLAEGTVRNIVSGILAKLGARSRSEAVARFVRDHPHPQR